MSGEDNIGKKIKERLEGHEFPVSGKLWENIYQNLPPEPASTPTDIPGKTLLGSSINTTFITSIVLIGMTAFVIAGLYLASSRSKTSKAVLPAKQILVPQQSKETLLETHTPASKAKKSPTTEVPTSTSIPFSLNRPTDTSINTQPDAVQRDILQEESASVIHNPASYLPSEESSRKGIYPKPIRDSESKVKSSAGTQSVKGEIKQSDKSKEHRENNAAKQSSSAKFYETDIKPSVIVQPGLKRSTHQKNSLFIKTTPAIVEQEDRLLAENTRQVNSNQINSEYIYKYTISKVEKSRGNLVHSQEVYTGLLSAYTGESVKTKILSSDRNNSLKTTSTTSLQNQIIPVKSKRTFMAADFSLDALMSIQYSSAFGDTSKVDSATHVQSRKATLTGGIRINYHIPLKHGRVGQSRVTISSGVLLDRIQSSYTRTHTHTKIDSTYIPIYEWRPSGPGATDSIRVLVDSVWNTQLNKQAIPVTEQKRVSYVGIPFTLSYNWHMAKWSIYLTAGAQINLLLNSSTTFSVNDTLQTPPRAETSQNLYRRVVPHFVGSAGVRYQFTEKLSFMVEPGFRYSLQSIYKHSYPLQQHIFVLGVKAGIRYKF